MERMVHTCICFILVMLSFSVQCTRGWTQWNETEFCRSVQSCSGNGSKPTMVPPGDVAKHHDNDTARICEKARRCSTTVNTDSGWDPNTADFEPDVVENNYQRKPNTTEFCSILNSCEHVIISEWQDNKMQSLRNISHYCPYSDYCGLSKSLTIPARDNTSTSCCGTCSCDPDCGVRRECCFWADDKYHAVERENLTCINLKMPTIYVGFLMIDTCPNGTRCDEQDTVPKPVSSARTKRIYINRRCAECHLNSDSEMAYITWPMSVKMTWDAYDVWNCLTDTCFRDYGIPPLHWPWIMNFACGKYYINECPPSTQNQGLVAACRNTHAPVLVFPRGIPSGRLYGNTYCIMCHKDISSYYTPSDLCDITAGRIQKGSSLSVLLDLDIVNKHKDEKEGTCNKNSEPGVVDKHQVACRAILCPEWMVKVNGKCRHFTKEWRNVFVSLQLTLRPYSKPIKASIFQNMTKDKRFNFHTWLSNECGLSLNINDQAVNIKAYMLPITIRNVTFVNELLLRMEYFWYYLKPSSFFKSIKRCTDSRWKIALDSDEYYLSAEFYHYKKFMPDGQKRRHHVSKNRTYSELSPLPKVYEPVTVSKHSYHSGREERYVLKFTALSTTITQMAFCDRVEIPLAEVDLLFGQIRIRSSNITLSDGQFTAGYTGKVLKHIYVCKEEDVKNAGFFSRALPCVMIVSMLVGFML